MESTDITKNGVTVHSFKNGNIHSFTVSLFIKGGVVYEAPDENGLAHFFEHMVFRNINAYMSGELYETLDLHGLYFNAATYVNYIEFSITGAMEHFETAAEIITKVLAPFIISKSELVLEAKRIKSEIREESENSLSRFSDRLVYQGSTLERPITGKCSDIDRYGLTTLANEQKRLITKENIFFYVGGNFSDQNIRDLVSLVEGYAVNSAPKIKNEAPLPTLFGKRNCFCGVKNASSTSVKLSFDIDTNDVTIPELFYLCDLLFAGESCPMYRELSENSGLIYSYDENVTYYGSFAVISVSFDIRSDKLMQALSMFFDLLVDAKESLGSRIPYIRPIYIDNIGSAIDDSESIAADFGYYNYILGLDIKTVDERKKLFASISEEMINALAQNTFTPDNLVIAVKGNKKKIKSDTIRNLAIQKLK